jgi:hypothetical protein
MFITRKRHDREKLESFGVNSQLSEAILRHVPQGVFLLDARDRIVPPVSRSLAVLFRRQDFGNLAFDRLLKPIVTANTLGLARSYVKSLRSAVSDSPTVNPLKDVEVRLVNPDGSFETAFYSFEFHSLEAGTEPGAWMVRVVDTTARVQQARELEDLRAELKVNAELLRAMMRMGSARLGGALQRIDAAMLELDAVLKKPAREPDAFRIKLEETLKQVDRVRRESLTLKITGLESAAQVFEGALHELSSREHLSGTDFLPLAVKLDDMSGQFALVRSLLAARDSPAAAQSSAAQSSAAPAAHPTEIVATVKTPTLPVPWAEATPADVPPSPAPVAPAASQPAARAPRAARTPRAPREAAPLAQPGSLEASLVALTDVIAKEHQKVVTLECIGLHKVPAHYLTAVKNITVQLIRNAVAHGIESSEQRLQAGKSAQGHLRLEFEVCANGTFDLMFEDDGRGLDPDQVRHTAVEKGLINADAAAKLRDRQAIKLIFKSGFTTIPSATAEDGRGSGLAVVRRYVHQAGGRIALASLAGHETRFKITMPPVPLEAAEAQVA